MQAELGELAHEPSGAVDTIGPVQAMPFSRRRHWKWPWISGTVMGVFLLAGAIGPWLSPHDPNETNLGVALRPPVIFGDGAWSYPFGTDQLGRDILSRLLAGARVSVLVAVAVVALAGTIGVVIAVVAGYFGGRIDAFLMRITDAMISFPFLLLAIVIVAIYGAGIWKVVIVLVLAGWPQYARVIRSEVLRIKTQDFITMSRVMGGGGRWTIVRHVVPNFVPTLLVLMTLQVGLAIIAEGSLSFLGIGVRPPDASWGNMLADGRNFLTTEWWIPVAPGVALSLTVLAANLLGDWLRVSLDPATRR